MSLDTDETQACLRTVTDITVLRRGSGQESWNYVTNYLTVGEMPWKTRGDWS
jgi:hypothetical protein